VGIVIDVGHVSNRSVLLRNHEVAVRQYQWPSPTTRWHAGILSGVGSWAYRSYRSPSGYVAPSDVKVWRPRPGSGSDSGQSPSPSQSQSPRQRHRSLSKTEPSTLHFSSSYFSGIIKNSTVPVLFQMALEEQRIRLLLTAILRNLGFVFPICSSASPSRNESRCYPYGVKETKSLYTLL